MMHDLMLPKAEYSSEWEALFRQVVEKGVDTALSLPDQFSTVLSLFLPGNYTLALAPTGEHDEWLEIPDWYY